MQIPMSSPDITDLELEAVSGVIRSARLALGPQIEAFEGAIAALSGAKYAVAVSSGTSGLHLCMIAAGVGEGDLVVTSPFSFIASANCILYERGVPLFVDVDPLTGNLDPGLVAEALHDLACAGPGARRWLPPALRDGPPGRLAALLPVHAFGQPAQMAALTQAAQEHGLVLVEDACEAIGAVYQGRHAGTFGDAGVFAFYPNKQMTTGEGGMIVTNRREWADLFRSLRNQGRDTFDAWLVHGRLGYNYRMDEMSAALGVVQSERLPELLARRHRVASWYNRRLRDSDLVETPFVDPAVDRESWFVYVVRIRPPAQRDAVMAQLAAQGIPSRPYFSPIHLQPFYRERFGYGRGCFPVTEYLGDVSLALPFSGIMSEEQVEYVCAELLACLKSAQCRT